MMMSDTNFTGDTSTDSSCVALPGKLAELAYRPCREMQFFPWVIRRAGGFVAQRWHENRNIKNASQRFSSDLRTLPFENATTAVWFFNGRVASEPKRVLPGGRHFPSAKLQSALALPGKLAELAYRPCREMQFFPWVIRRAGGFVAQRWHENRNIKNASQRFSSGLRSIYLLFLVLGVAPLLPLNSRAAAQEPASQTAQQETELTSVELTWANGDRIQGRLSQWDSTGLRVLSGLYREPIGIDVSSLELIRFPTTSLPSGKSSAIDSDLSNSAPHSLVLIDGSQLRGQLVDSAGETIRFDDYRFGVLSIPAPQVAEVNSSSSSLYAWAGDIEPWLEASSKLPGKWQVDDINLTTKQTNSQLWLPLSLDDSFSVDFAIHSDSSLDFVIATGANPERSLRLGRIGDSWILGTADNFEIVEQLVAQTKKLELQLKWDASTKTITLHEGNTPVLTVNDPESSSMRSGIFLCNQGKSLTVTRLQVSGKGLKKSAELPSFNRPILPPKPQSFDWAQWSDGSSVWCEVESISAGKLKLRLAGQSVACSTNGLQVIKPRANNERTTQKIEVSTKAVASVGTALEDTPHRLIYGQNRLSGRFEIAAREQKIVWHSVNFSQPAVIDHSRPLSLEQNLRGMVVAPVSYQQLRDVVRLENGDQLPSLVQRTSSTQAWLQLPFTSDSVVAPLNQLRSLELNANSSKPPSYTEESRRMLLSIPRNLEEDSYTHAIVGRNGDLLRGNLIAVNDETVEIDSKFTPMVLDRSVVASLVRLKPKRKPTEKSAESDEPNGQSLKSNAETPEALEHLLRIQLPGTFSISGRWLGGTQDSILLENSALGKCTIPFADITGLAFGPVEPDPLQGYFAWNTALTISPRWKASAESAGQAASELVGTKAPQLELADIHGQTFRLADHVGKVVVLDFWATWCGPCIASLPEYLEVAGQFPDTELLFVGVNSTDTPETIRDFLRTKDWREFSTLMDFDRSAAAALRVQGIPHTVVIGPDGKIEHIHVGYTKDAAEQLRLEIQQLLKR